MNIKVSSHLTRGALTVALDEIPPGGGPPLHSHDNEDELFIVQEGRVSYFLQNQWIELGPGEMVFAPRGSAHAFRNTGGVTARHYVLLTPGGFEKFLASCADEFARQGGPRMERILDIGTEHGLHFLGMPPEPPAYSGALNGGRGDHLKNLNQSGSLSRARGETTFLEQVPAENGDEDQALRNLVAALQDAWNAGDSVAWAAHFASDADFIHILGGHFCGYESIEKGHRTIFDTIYQGSSIRCTVHKIRFLAPNTALVFVLSELKVTQPGLPPLMRARPTLTVQKLGGSWKIVSLQNTLITEQPAGPRRASEGILSQLNNTIAQAHPVHGHAGPPLQK